MPNSELATLAGGCFWCLEAVFRQVRGVHTVLSGYMGGRRPNPTYEQVSTGATGHAEVVQITYDPTLVTFEDLLDIFFAIHDPTTMNRQGNDVGTQYRSAIFYHSEEQKQTAEATIATLMATRVVLSPIVTEVTAADRFYPAEAYHQSYFESNPNQPYCRLVVAPKLEKFRNSFAQMQR